MSAADRLRRAPRRRNAMGNVLEGIDANVLQNLRQGHGERTEEDPEVLPAAEESALPTSPRLQRRRNAVPDVRVGVERAELRRLRELYGVSWRPNGLFLSNAV